ncbi:MAG: hypothetical protein ABII00_01800 [Elusimicrobiota bacterium]
MRGLWAPVVQRFEPAALFLNSGGPMSRTRVETIRSSLLGGETGAIRCPRVIRLALDFGDGPPVKTIEALLTARGRLSPEELRAEYAIPRKRLICRPDRAPRPLKAVSASQDDVLETALMLGLCTRVLYDPSRPVLWTEASLTRRLEVFDPEGFYA